MADTSAPSGRELTRPELDILKLLWSDEPLSAREIHEHLPPDYGWAYSTTRTTLERMVRKGLVGKRRFHGLHLYSAALSRTQGMAELVRDFASRVLQVDPTAVVPLFARGHALSREELRELERLLGGEEGKTR